MQKLFFVLGLGFLALALLWPLLQQLHPGRLPGDIVIQRDGFRFYFPVTTMLIVSLVISLLLWLFRR